jgi:hypothetical protein
MMGFATNLPAGRQVTLMALIESITFYTYHRYSKYIFGPAVVFHGGFVATLRSSACSLFDNMEQRCFLQT